MPVVTPAQLLLALAEHGSLEAGAAALGLSVDDARSLLRGAAVALKSAPALPAAAPSGKPPAAPARKPAAKDPGTAARATRAVGIRATGLVDAPDDHRARPAPGGGHRRLRVFSDGASRGNPGPAGAGAVILDDQGNIVERLGRFLGRQTNNVAEYEGLLLGLGRAHELGAREVEVRADSELLIRQLQGRYRVKNPELQRLHAEAMALLKGFSYVGLSHVPREENGAADEMSNRAIDEKM
ncbi:MAG TPA: ribonuclease HI family protein [Myxococcales bacterium]|jgi:ribonuclease HI|nr:ribonuclease HI family protein [Myxococcales bacterium]